MAGYLGHKPTISNYTVDEFTTSSAQASSGNFTLSQTVTDLKTLEVSVGGIDQPQSAYSVTGTTLAFGASVVTLGDIVIARHAGESISYPSLETGAVTASTIGTGAVTAVKIDSAVSLGGPSLGTNSVIRTNAKTISENITFAGTENGMTIGPITVANTYSVTVTSGSTWTIV